MAGFVKGDVVVLPFPFSDLPNSKRRPALVLALTAVDFDSDSLSSDSFIKPTRIFTADRNIIVRKVGTIKDAVRNKVVQKIISVIQ